MVRQEIPGCIKCSAVYYLLEGQKSPGATQFLLQEMHDVLAFPIFLPSFVDIAAVIDYKVR